jgi:hypothetical protein
MIEESETRIKKYIKKMLAENSATSNTQLMTVSEDDRKAIVARAMTGVASYIQREVMTPLKDLREMVITTAQQQDGDQLVTEYRRRLHETISGDGEETLKITGKVEKKTEAEQKLKEFRKQTLFFNDGSDDD